MSATAAGAARSIRFVPAEGGEEQSSHPSVTRAKLHELQTTDTPPPVTAGYMEEMDKHIRGFSLEPLERVQWTTVLGNSCHQITSPKLPSPYDMVDSRVLSMVCLLSVKELADWCDKWTTGKKPWPEIGDPWQGFLAHRLPILLNNLSAQAKNGHLLEVITAERRGQQNKHAGLGFGKPQAVELLEDYYCGSCQCRVSKKLERQIPTCMYCSAKLDESTIQGRAPSESVTTVIPTNVGTWMLHPGLKHWILLNGGRVDAETSKDIQSEWGLDLTRCSEPMQELNEEELNSLKNLLMEIAENKDTNDDQGWNIGQRLKRFFDANHAGRNNIEKLIKDLGIEGRIKMHYNNCEEADASAPKPCPTLSFHPMAARLGSLMKAAGGGVPLQAKPSSSRDTASPASPGAGLSATGEGGDKPTSSDSEDPTTMSDVEGLFSKGSSTRKRKKEKKKNKGRKRASVFQRAYDGYFAQAGATVQETGPDGVAALISKLDPDSSDLTNKVIKGSAVNRQRDKEGKEHAAKFKLAIYEAVLDGSFQFMRPYLEGGIAQNAQWIDTDGNLDEWIKIQNDGARQGTELETQLKRVNKNEWEIERRSPFIGDNCYLWDDSPNLQQTGKPPATPVERCNALAGLVKKFKWERRILYSTWNRRAGPAPAADQEAAELLLHGDMRQCTFIGNSYGSLGLRINHPLAQEEFHGEAEDAVGASYTYGNTLPDTLEKHHGKRPEVSSSTAEWIPETDQGMEVDEGEGTQTSPGAGLSATRGGADSPTPFTLYENSWCPGPLVTPLLARDARSPEEHHWTRSMATYTFAHLLSENYLNCTLTQILQAWNAMPKVYEGGAVARRR